MYKNSWIKSLGGVCQTEFSIKGGWALTYKEVDELRRSSELSWGGCQGMSVQRRGPREDQDTL